jgi:hypothetical protein
MRPSLAELVYGKPKDQLPGPVEANEKEPPQECIDPALVWEPSPRGTKEKHVTFTSETLAQLQVIKERWAVRGGPGRFRGRGGKGASYTCKLGTFIPPTTSEVIRILIADEYRVKRGPRLIGAGRPREYR